MHCKAYSEGRGSTLVSRYILLRLRPETVLTLNMITQMSEIITNLGNGGQKRALCVQYNTEA